MPVILKKIPHMKPLLLFLVSFSALQLSAQTETWEHIYHTDAKAEGPRLIVPERYEVFRLNINALKAQLAGAPLEDFSMATEITLPLPDGTTAQFGAVN